MVALWKCIVCAKYGVNPDEHDHAGEGRFGEEDGFCCRFNKTELFCFRCGVRGIHREDSEGDYYVGPQYYCPSCKLEFTMG